MPGKEHGTLSIERLKSVLEYKKESGKFFWLLSTRATKAGDEAGYVMQAGYRKITIDGRCYYAERLAWFYVHEAWPDNTIDHINGDRGDNRFDNLRDVTRSVNSHNTNALGNRNTTGYRGVARYMDKFIAQIMVDGERHAIGMYDTAKEASDAYEAYRLSYFGGQILNDSKTTYPRESRSKKVMNN